METVDQLLKGMLSLVLRWDLSTSTSLSLRMDHVPSDLFLSREDDDEVRDDFCSFYFTLCHAVLTVVNRKYLLNSACIELSSILDISTHSFCYLL